MGQRGRVAAENDLTIEPWLASAGAGGAAVEPAGEAQGLSPRQGWAKRRGDADVRFQRMVRGYSRGLIRLTRGPRASPRLSRRRGCPCRLARTFATGVVPVAHSMLPARRDPCCARPATPARRHGHPRRLAPRKQGRIGSAQPLERGSGSKRRHGCRSAADMQRAEAGHRSTAGGLVGQRRTSRERVWADPSRLGSQVGCQRGASLPARSACAPCTRLVLDTSRPRPGLRRRTCRPQTGPAACSPEPGSPNRVPSR